MMTTLTLLLALAPLTLCVLHIPRNLPLRLVYDVEQKFNVVWVLLQLEKKVKTEQHQFKFVWGCGRDVENAAAQRVCAGHIHLCFNISTLKTPLDTPKTQPSIIHQQLLSVHFEKTQSVLDDELGDGWYGISGVFRNLPRDDVNHTLHFVLTRRP